MTVRFWVQTVKSRKQSSRREVVNSGITTLERLDFVQVTKSTTLVSEIMPDINTIWFNRGESRMRARYFVSESLLPIPMKTLSVSSRRKWPMQISIWAEILTFIAQIWHLSLRTIRWMRSRSSTTRMHTLLAFCSFPHLATEVHVLKISYDSSTAIIGNKYHQME